MQLKIVVCVLDASEQLIFNPSNLIRQSGNIASDSIEFLGCHISIRIAIDTALRSVYQGMIKSEVRVNNTRGIAEGSLPGISWKICCVFVSLKLVEKGSARAS